MHFKPSNWHFVAGFVFENDTFRGVTEPWRSTGMDRLSIFPSLYLREPRRSSRCHVELGTIILGGLLRRVSEFDLYFGAYWVSHRCCISLRSKTYVLGGK